MAQRKVFFVLLFALIVGIIAFSFYSDAVEAPGPAPDQLPPKDQVYKSEEQRLAFEVPAGYYLSERETGASGIPETTIVIIEDTEENRSILEGTLIELREGPTAITLDIYANPENLSPELWMQQQTNWGVGVRRTMVRQVDGKTGVIFAWDGLYAGKSVVVTEGGKTYVFSVTWMTEEDQILFDYEGLLASVKFQ